MVCPDGMSLALLFADDKGTVLEHPYLRAAVRSGENVFSVDELDERPIGLPEFGTLAYLPGRVPIGIDPRTGEAVPLMTMELGGRTFRPHAVGALLPPGYTRTLLPAEVPQAASDPLPQWAYTAAAWSKKGPVVFALRTDRRRHWDPSRYSTPEIRAEVKARLADDPTNRVLQQLRTCALVYRCTTSQNTFYERDEAAIPASIGCNAACVGCI